MALVRVESLCSCSINPKSHGIGVYITYGRLNSRCWSKLARIDLRFRGNKFRQQRIILSSRQNWMHTLLERRDRPQSNT